MLSTRKLELEIIGQLTKQAGRRLWSHELAQISIQLFQQQCAQGAPNALAQILLRLALKACPYAPNAAEILSAYKTITRQRADCEMPILAEWMAQLEANSLPLPIIISCEKYLDKARRAADELTNHYFGIRPIIVTGGMDFEFEDNCGQILRLPVSDVYEALPYKVFETWAFFEALGVRHGVIKIDDDLQINQNAALDIERVRSAFAAADYMGIALSSPHHDRAWHQGKCASPVAPVYGKPFLAPWARGALYYLSKSALEQLTSHYLRFPGCLDGELYEDKAVGDVLYTLGIRAVNEPLERILQISTDAPERGLNAAE